VFNVLFSRIVFQNFDNFAEDNIQTYLLDVEGIHEINENIQQRYKVFRYFKSLILQNLPNVT